MKSCGVKALLIRKKGHINVASFCILSKLLSKTSQHPLLARHFEEDVLVPAQYMVIGTGIQVHAADSLLLIQCITYIPL